MIEAMAAAKLQGIAISGVVFGLSLGALLMLKACRWAFRKYQEGL